MFQCLHKSVLHYIHSTFTDSESATKALLNSPKKFQPCCFSASGFPWRLSDWHLSSWCLFCWHRSHKLILLCSCLAESNLLEFKSQPNLVYYAVEKIAYKVYNKCAILMDLSDIGIKKVKKISFLSWLCLERCCLLCS